MGVLLCGHLLAQQSTLEAPSSSNQEKVSGRKKIPSPILSSSGKISVGCRSEERANYRWPVMKFADKVLTNFEASFAPIGSIESPLYISIGDSTDASETKLSRRVLAMGSSFSQLVIGVPNPDAVDLDNLRFAIVEAFLREECKTRTGKYANFKWPQWFVRGMTCASFGTVWKAQAYEVVYHELDTGALPTLATMFSNTAETISNETAAFFAMWVMSNLSQKERYQRLTAPWEAESILGFSLTEQHEAAWQAWVKQQDGIVFLPGSITARHFDRWQAELILPTSREEAVQITDYLTRSTIGRPQLFRDLTVLYLEAYVAWLQEGEEGYLPKRQVADEAAKILKDHLSRNPMLVDEAIAPAMPTKEWQIPNETK